MIFETDKFNFDSHQSVKMQFTNDFTIIVVCGYTDCKIQYGYGEHDYDLPHEKVVPLDQAEKTVVDLIQKNVKPQGARLVAFARSKHNKASEYKRHFV